MFKDELFLVVGLEHHRVLVKRTDSASQLHAAQQVNRDGVFLFAGRIQERILDVLCRLTIHADLLFQLDDSIPSKPQAVSKDGGK